MFVPQPSSVALGKPGSSPANNGAETETSQAETRKLRQALLGFDPAMLVGMEASPDCCHSRDRGPMASGRLPALLEGNFQSAKTDGAKTDFSANEGTDFPYGRGEPDLGSATYSRRATDAGLRCL